MKRTFSVAVVSALAVWVATATTGWAYQAPVNFAGRWVLESEPLASVPTELVVQQTVGSGSALPSKVTVTRYWPSGASTEVLHVGTVGGTVPGSGGGPRTFRRIAWEDSHLVVEVETLRGQTGSRSPSELRREAWSVTPEGRLQIVITESGPARTPQTVSLVYRQVKGGIAQGRDAV